MNLFGLSHVFGETKISFVILDRPQLRLKSTALNSVKTKQDVSPLSDLFHTLSNRFKIYSRLVHAKKI